MPSTHALACSCCAVNCCNCDCCNDASGKTPSSLLITVGGLVDGTDGNTDPPDVFPCSFFNTNFLAPCATGGDGCTWTSPALEDAGAERGPLDAVASAVVNADGTLTVTVTLTYEDPGYSGECVSVLTFTTPGPWDCNSSVSIPLTSATGCCGEMDDAFVTVSPIFDDRCSQPGFCCCACWAVDGTATVATISGIGNGDCACASLNGDIASSFTVPTPSTYASPVFGDGSCEVDSCTPSNDVAGIECTPCIEATMYCTSGCNPSPPSVPAGSLWAVFVDLTCDNVSGEGGQCHIQAIYTTTSPWDCGDDALTLSLYSVTDLGVSNDGASLFDPPRTGCPACTWDFPATITVSRP